MASIISLLIVYLIIIPMNFFVYSFWIFIIISNSKQLLIFLLF